MRRVGRTVARRLFALLVFCSTVSAANGRFPRALRAVEHPTDRDTIALGATYGVLTTGDRGRSWHYVCESAFTDVENYVGDPLVDFTPAGDLMIGTQFGLVVTRDGGCTWDMVLGSRVPATLGLVDFTVRRDMESILALVSRADGDELTTHLEESTDDGASFSPVGLEIPIAFGYTLESARSDPNVIYVSGLDEAGVGVLAVSNDRGENWSLRAIPGTDTLDAPYIAAVHPVDPQRLFVRTDGKLPQQVIARANDALFYSEDGGQSFFELMRRPAKLLGFALSPDGETLLIGYGDPVAATEYVDVRETGAFMTTLAGEPDAFEFELVLDGSVTCLRWTESGIFVCRPEVEESRHLSEAPSASSLQASDLVPLLELDEVLGPLPCADTVCDRAWADNCLLFDSCQGGAGGQSTGGETGAPSDAQPPDPTPLGPPRGGACNCDIAAIPKRRVVPLLLPLAALLVWRRRTKVRRAAERETF